MLSRQGGDPCECPRKLSYTAWCLATLRADDRQTWNIFASVAQRKVATGRFAAQDVAGIMWGFAKVQLYKELKKKEKLTR